MKELKRISEQDAIYLAGFFDGEGCVGIYQRSAGNSGPGAKNPNISALLSICNTNFAVLQHIVNSCGGWVTTLPRKCAPKLNGGARQKQWRWSAGPRETAHILAAILPYLIVKRDQAELALQFHRSVLEYMHRPHPGHNGKPALTKEEVQRRFALADKMKAMKRQD